MLIESVARDGKIHDWDYVDGCRAHQASARDEDGRRIFTRCDLPATHGGDHSGINWGVGYRVTWARS